MKAVVLYEYGDIDKLRLKNDQREPPFAPNEVRVRVRATSINPIDWKLRSGAARNRMPLKFPAILGRDLPAKSSIWAATSQDFKKGMRVMALAYGTYAEFTTVRADILAPIPDKLSFEQAAALPLVLTTGAQLIERAVKVQPGWTILVTGAVGGVGRTAVHVARQTRRPRHRRRKSGASAKKRRNSAQIASSRSTTTRKSPPSATSTPSPTPLAAKPSPGCSPRSSRAACSARCLGEPEAAKGKDIKVARRSWRSPTLARLYELADDVARGEFTIPIAKKFRSGRCAEAQDFAEHEHPNGKVLVGRLKMISSAGPGSSTAPRDSPRLRTTWLRTIIAAT